jgi:hypothetical protein
MKFKIDFYSYSIDELVTIENDLQDTLDENGMGTNAGYTFLKDVIEQIRLEYENRGLGE